MGPTTNFSSPQQLKTLENSPNTPLNRLPPSKTPRRAVNKGERTAEIGPREKLGQKTAEIIGDFFNRIVLKRSLTVTQRGTTLKIVCE